MAKQESKPKSSGGSPNKKKPLLPKSKWQVVLVNSTAEKVLGQFLDEEGQVDSSNITQNDNFNKREARNFTNLLQDYQDAYEDYQKSVTDAQKEATRAELFKVFDELISDSQTYYKTHSEVSPFIENEWRYETLEAQKADLADLETERANRIEWVKNCPFDLTDRAVEEIMKIDTEHIGRH